MNLPWYWFIAPLGSILALIFAYIFYSEVKKHDPGTERMQEIAGYIKDGAYAYLKQQYIGVSIFFLIAFLVFNLMAWGLDILNTWVPIAFVTGGFFSGLAGFIGMKTATMASSRTAQACSKSLNKGLKVAFRAGSVMGLVVVGLALIFISGWFYILTSIGMELQEITVVMLSFGMGASTQALFARLGGGIYTKAADVGADLVGKIEEGIPEDDPRNPATIADNVGDNVGDVAGMGADLFESYVGSILATSALGMAAVVQFGSEFQTQWGLNFVIAPMILAGVGIILSIIGIYMVSTKDNATSKDLLFSLNKSVYISSILIAIASGIICKLLLHPSIYLGVFIASITGLIAGVLIGYSTERYTSDSYSPTQGIAKQGEYGPATVIIDGLAVGMRSTAAPVIIIATAILIAFSASGGWSSIELGLYGIGFGAVGMLATLGVTLAMDAFGPIADNAGGNAAMSGLPEIVRSRTDALDAVGNTTAATGKGFAIGSAALTAMALLAAYIEEIRVSLTRVDPQQLINGLSLRVAGVADFMAHYEINLMNPKLLAGAFVGSMIAFLFASYTLKAVGNAAGDMVKEVRRQFKEIPGILEGKTTPDYKRCVLISTKGAQREMVKPAILAIITPIIIGLILGIPGVLGLLVGTLISGLVLAILMNNSGGAWDNAKKFVETGKFGGKNSDAHTATIVGDTVGDPLKDTAGPSLNILIKLMSIVSIIFAGLIISYSPYIEHIYDQGYTDINMMLQENNPREETLKDIEKWEKEAEVKIDVEETTENILITEEKEVAGEEDF
jgi:K(+)-stimulated pyrophosphate-energized sodium pump